MGDKIRFGIIGGGMAGPLNAGALRDIPEAEVVAFCDVKEDVAKEFSKEYNIPSYYTDYKGIPSTISVVIPGYNWL